MSVLNDVLKNLEAEKARRQLDSLSAESKTAFSSNLVAVANIRSLPNIVWVILVVMAIAIAVLAIQVYVLRAHTLEVPLEIYGDAPITHVVEKDTVKNTLAPQPPLSPIVQTTTDSTLQSTPQSTQQPTLQSTPQSIHSQTPSQNKTVSANASTTIASVNRDINEKKTPSENSESRSQSEPHRKNEISARNKQPEQVLTEPKSGEHVVRKALSTQAQEQAVSALAQGKAEQVKQVMVHADPLMQQNLTLRLMLKESPERVLPYMRQQVPDFAQNNELLAIAAQAQQRVGQHKQAALYYEQLVKRQPHDIRWQAGLAISLDGIGDADTAIILYRKILTHPDLPSALRRFVQGRYARLEAQHG